MNMYSEQDCEAMAQAWVSKNLHNLGWQGEPIGMTVNRIKADLMLQLHVPYPGQRDERVGGL